MYREEIERQNFEAEIKRLKYEKWLAENKHASSDEKDAARWIYIHCNNFRKRNIKKRF